MLHIFKEPAKGPNHMGCVMFCGEIMNVWDAWLHLHTVATLAINGQKSSQMICPDCWTKALEQVNGVKEV